MCCSVVLIKQREKHMSVEEILKSHLSISCPNIHSTRLQAVIDVATGLQKSRNLSLTAIGRNLAEGTSIKHRIKKVDRLLGNKHLYKEVTDIYKGLSSYVMQYVSQNTHIPIIIDLCFMKDNNEVQMLSAELALKGRSLPIYRDVFESSNLKKRAPQFLDNLSRCLPNDKEVLIIMDAGFGEDWFDAISNKGWYWLVRARGKKFIQLSPEQDWVDARDVYDSAISRAKNYPKAYITKQNPRSCRIVIKSKPQISVRKRPKRLPRNYNSGNRNYSRSAQEPWVLVTNLPDNFTTSQIVNSYEKRMQIEESFRDVKSHQFGLSARYIQTVSIYRWSIAMLLAAIVQVTLWLIGVIAHHTGMQSYFQPNTVKNKKVYSYFYLGQLIVEHYKIDHVLSQCNDLHEAVQQELNKKW